MKLKRKANSSKAKSNQKFEDTARDATWQKHLTELALDEACSKGRRLMTDAKLPEKLKDKLSKEAFATAALLNDLMAENCSGKVQSQFETNPNIAKHLRTWGEAGMVKTKATLKLKNRGEQYMFVGHANNHVGDKHRMWNPETRKVRITQNVTWLN